MSNSPIPPPPPIMAKPNHQQVNVVSCVKVSLFVRQYANCGDGQARCTLAVSIRRASLGLKVSNVRSWRVAVLSNSKPFSPKYFHQSLLLFPTRYEVHACAIIWCGLCSYTYRSESHFGHLSTASGHWKRKLPPIHGVVCFHTILSLLSCQSTGLDTLNKVATDPGKKKKGGREFCCPVLLYDDKQHESRSQRDLVVLLGGWVGGGFFLLSSVAGASGNVVTVQRERKEDQETAARKQVPAVEKKRGGGKQQTHTNAHTHTFDNSKYHGARSAAMAPTTARTVHRCLLTILLRPSHEQ